MKWKAFLFHILLFATITNVVDCNNNNNNEPYNNSHNNNEPSNNSNNNKKPPNKNHNHHNNNDEASNNNEPSNNNNNNNNNSNGASNNNNNNNSNNDEASNNIPFPSGKKCNSDELLTVHPNTVYFLGGEEVELSGPCFDVSSELVTCYYSFSLGKLRLG
jgi:hypothetical protein